jgi:hypothetical protein
MSMRDWSDYRQQPTKSGATALSPCTPNLRRATAPRGKKSRKHSGVTTAVNAGA